MEHMPSNSQNIRSPQAFLDRKGDRMTTGKMTVSPREQNANGAVHTRVQLLRKVDDVTALLQTDVEDLKMNKLMLTKRIDALSGDVNTLSCDVTTLRTRVTTTEQNLSTTHKWLIGLSVVAGIAIIGFAITGILLFII